MPTEIIAEGHTDAAVVRALGIELPKPVAESPGREAAIRRAADAVKLIGNDRIVLLLDRNGHSPAEVEAEVLDVLRDRWGVDPARQGGWFREGSRGVRLVLAGLPQDPLLQGLGVRKHAMDDYVLRLLLDDGGLRDFCKGERNLAYVPKDAAEFRSILEKGRDAIQSPTNRLETSKRYVHLASAVIGFGATRATLAQKVVDRASASLRMAVLGGLEKDLRTDPPF